MKKTKTKKEKNRHILVLVLLILNSIGIVALICFVVLGLTIYRNVIPDSVIGVACTVLGFLLPLEKTSFENYIDKMPWQSDLRYLLRRKEIGRKTYIRTSYAGFLIVKVQNKYLLVKNEHGLGLYQLCARTYPLSFEESESIKKRFNAENDPYIKDTSYCDYRYLVPSSELKRFFKHFERSINPETYDYSSIIGDIVHRCRLNPEIFNKCKTTFLGRKINKIEFSRYTNYYEMIVSDISVFEPNEEQFKELLRIGKNKADKFEFATIKEIKANGVDAENGKLRADIAPFTYDLLDYVYDFEEEK